MRRNKDAEAEIDGRLRVVQETSCYLWDITTLNMFGPKFTLHLPRLRPQASDALFVAPSTG